LISALFDVGVCRLAGAHANVVGLVSPDEALDALMGPVPGTDGATLLATYPSYLACLVTAAERRGLGPADFRLRRVDVGGEVLSPALAAAARERLGVPLIYDTFAMTEVLPVSGRTCTGAEAGAEPVTPRQIVEALESLPTRPWPARYRAETIDGRVVLTVAAEAVAGLGVEAAREHLADHGLDVELRTVATGDPRTLRRVRADLVETTFAEPAFLTEVGA
jgi:hypothetical protein